MYSLVRKLLFKLDAENAHELSLDFLGAAERLKLTGLLSKPDNTNPVEVFGIQFPNAVGLAAGLDKNADYYNALGDLGFGFIEVGTVTPKPQAGNDKPRLFRLPTHEAIINRMGFNNKGVDYLVERIKNRRYSGVLGVNIGKNKITPEENALDDYIYCLERVYPYADYVTVNISSPNTPGLRNLQFGEALKTLLAGIKLKQKELAEIHNIYKPILVKIAPDMTPEEIQNIAQTFNEQAIDGVIATNTTIDKSAVDDDPHGQEAGGLSGIPVFDKSTDTLKILKSYLDDSIPVIGVGGIHDIDSAEEKFEVGASLIQIYSAFIYQGPKLIKELVEFTNRLPR